MSEEWSLVSASLSGRMFSSEVRGSFEEGGEMANQFETLIERRHDNAAGWKKNGKKIIGYICSYGLEELLSAGGLQPVRIFGPGGPYQLSKEHIQPYYCQHCHGALDEALKGSYQYLDGLVFLYTCEHARAAYDSWRVNIPVGYTHFIDMPSQTDLPEAEALFVDELKSFSASLEKAFGAKITADSLRASIKLHNTSRALLKEIYSYKAAQDPVVSGSEVFAAIMSSTVTPKEEHNRSLEGFLKELKGRKKPAGAGPRVMLLGTEVHDPDVIKAIEEAGVRVVADELCTGTRLIWENVREDQEPLAAIARRYLTGINCPVKRPADGRMAHIGKIVDEYKPQGALVLQPKHCDPNEWDIPFILQMFKEKNIPMGRVELDEVFSPDHVKRAVNQLKAKL